MTQHVEQPMPARNDHVSIQSLVRADLETRELVGIERYGTALQPNNGRDALRDLYEELLDGACYVKQAMVERELTEHDSGVTRLRERLAAALKLADDLLILFTYAEKGHPGRPCIRTGWVDETAIARLRERRAALEGSPGNGEL